MPGKRNLFLPPFHRTQVPRERACPNYKEPKSEVLARSKQYFDHFQFYEMWMHGWISLVATNGFRKCFGGVLAQALTKPDNSAFSIAGYRYTVYFLSVIFIQKSSQTRLDASRGSSISTEYRAGFHFLFSRTRHYNGCTHGPAGVAQIASGIDKT